MTFQRFNLNSVIKVRLNDKGFEHWQQEHEKFLPKKYHHELSHYKNKADEAGYVEFQAWDFMQLFGNVTGLGYVPLYDCEVLIKTENLKADEIFVNEEL